MNQQDVFERVNLVSVKTVDRDWKSGFILIGMLAALLVILITAVSIQQSTSSPSAAVAASAGDSLYANPELKSFAAAVSVSSSRNILATNPELKVVETYTVNGRDVLAMNPELKAVQAYSATGPAQFESGFLKTNPEVGTFLRYQD